MNLKKRTNGSWVDTSCYIHKTATDTFANLPVALYPTGATSTVELKGNTVQNGTPTPDNPIIPQGTGERTGNLLDFEQLKNAPPGTIGSITFSHVLTLQLKANTYYTMASNGTGSTSSTPADLYRSVFFNATDKESSVNKNNPVTLLTDSTGVVRIVFFSARTNAQQYLNGEAQLWINEGSTALPYEPYGYKIPISSANTTTPVYLGEVETTRRIRKLVLTGEENWRVNPTPPDSHNVMNTILYDVLSGISPICTHYTGSIDYQWVSLPENHITTSIKSGNYIRLAVNVGTESLDDFKTYLADQYAAGTPVTVWYVLAEPETAVVNEPLMKIGDYADIASDISVPVTAGGDTISVDATVQPSGVAINYKGWHNAKCKEYSYNMTIADWESASISQMENHTIQELQGGNWV